MLNKLIKLVFVTAIMASVAGCAGTPNSESTGEYLDNTAITAKIKSELALSDETSALEIEVDTFKDTVLLSGFVDSEAEKLAAQRIAESVDGVTKIKNTLVVK